MPGRGRLPLVVKGEGKRLMMELRGLGRDKSDGEMTRGYR